MSQITIATASQTLLDLLSSLDNAYWEATSIEQKDRTYNLIHLLQGESTELLKVSVLDGHYPYEAITFKADMICTLLIDFDANLGKSLLRSQTHTPLSLVLHNAIKTMS